MKISSFPPGIGAAAAYLLCLLLVPVYVNMFPIWKYLSTRFGDAFFVILPPVILFLFLGCIVFLRLRAGAAAPQINKALVGWGVLLCCLGLLCTDPEFPVKRVHVFEYAFLCLVARYGMSHYLHGLPLFLFSACFGAILGIHDEFLQGLHPARTFGLSDMGVNLLGSFGGGLIWHGLHLFSSKKSSAINGVDLYFLAWLLVSVLLLVLPAWYYRGLVVEIWVALPLLAAPVYYFIYQDQFTRDVLHGATVICAAAVSLAVYPLLTKIPGIVFY